MKGERLNAVAYGYKDCDWFYFKRIFLLLRDLFATDLKQRNPTEVIG